MYPGTYAAQTPDRIAAVMAGPGETGSYGELERRSAQLARVLNQAGRRRLSGVQGGGPAESLGERARLAFGFNTDTVYLSPGPIYHAAPLRFCGAVQALGGTVVMMKRFDAEQALQAIGGHRATHAQFVPTMFVRMLQLPQEVRDRYDVSSLRVAIHAAAPCPVEVKQEMIDWWGPILVEYYAGTEGNGMTAIDSGTWLAKPGTVGRPILGTVRICADDGAELPAGQTGGVSFERDEGPLTHHHHPAQTPPPPP